LDSYFVGAGLVRTASVDNTGQETVSSIAKHRFTLYTFDNDAEGVSNCNAACVNNWPPLIANDGAEAEAPYSIIVRNSGVNQWALNGKPLYFFAGDTAAEDTNGDGAGNGVWHIARNV